MYFKALRWHRTIALIEAGILRVLPTRLAQRCQTDHPLKKSKRHLTFKLLPPSCCCRQVHATWSVSQRNDICEISKVHEPPAHSCPSKSHSVAVQSWARYLSKDVDLPKGGKQQTARPMPSRKRGGCEKKGNGLISLSARNGERGNGLKSYGGTNGKDLRGKYNFLMQGRSGNEASCMKAP